MHKIQFTEICYIDYDDPKFALSIINLVLVTCSVQLMDLFGTPKWFPKLNWVSFHSWVWIVETKVLPKKLLKSLHFVTWNVFTFLVVQITIHW